MTPDVSARLDRLERQNRRLRRGLAAVGGALALAATLGFASPAAEEVRATKFVLTDAAGDTLGELAVDNTGAPYLMLRKERANAILAVNGPALSLRGDDGKRGAWIGVDPQGAAGVSVYGARLLDGVRLQAKPDGTSAVYLQNGEGRERVALETLLDGTSSVTARNRQGEVRAFFGMGKNDVPSALFFDEKGFRRLGMLVGPGGIPIFSLDDGTGRSRLELTERLDGTPRMRMVADDGGTLFEAP